MLKNVKHTITDFGIGASTVKGEGVHIKIGVSHIESNIPLTITGSMDADKISGKLGDSPLADSCMDSINSGCNMIYALPVPVGTAGVVEEKSKSVTGTGEITLTGSPYNEHTVQITITATGGRNVGAFKYVVDDGDVSEEETIPITGTYVIAETGLTINFGEGTFEKDDTVIYSCTAPKMNNQGVMEALGKIKNLNINFEFIHIVGATEKALWAALTVEGEKFFDVYYKPCVFVCEVRPQNTDETLDQYAQYLREQKEGTISRNLQVVSHRLAFMRNGKEVNINAANVIMGLHARAKVQQSIGEVAEFDIKGALAILPSGIEDYTSELDDLGYTTLRQYSGIEGIYVNNSKTFAKEGSDFAYTERVRAMYKAVRETRKTALTKMHTQVDLSNQEASLKAIVEFINVPVERMVDEKELSSARVEIPEDQDILGTEKLYFKIRAVPIGILREIEIDAGFENPAL
ncbi:DUF2586 domain-containing protein [Cellulosilyticum sp. I15G10I2]|uniref:DUF2586 domain-containing protein n=1 Tax=Cellulosilyticum sp. I15G10I2 TaxID=1892843 RepID=UPI00085BB203|nr:DUF2586 domain-containing protein [Cellulosilyticum sp. I15G10I2]